MNDERIVFINREIDNDTSMVISKIIETLFTHKTAVWILFVMSISMILMLVLGWLLGQSGYGTLLVGSISGYIAIANAILIYETLMSHNKSIGNQEATDKRTRFENTFFNFLEYHQKISSLINFNVKQLDKNLNEIKFEVNRQNFFSFALNQLNRIEVCLNSETFLGYFDYEKDKHTLESLQEQIMFIQSKQGVQLLNEDIPKKIKLFIDVCEKKYVNTIYDITNEQWVSLYSCNLNKKEFAYSMFCNKYSIHFEHYLRSLKTLLLFITNHWKKEEDVYYYIDFITTLMNKDELLFIKTYLSLDNEFNQIFTKLEISKIHPLKH